jgi:hypothetical protein
VRALQSHGNRAASHPLNPQRRKTALPDQHDAASDTVLLAYVTVHLQNNESFELLPFEDAQDVKSKVSDLLADWARSGFLIRGSRIYPWHQVRLIEANEVLDLRRDESTRRIAEWQARDLAHMQQSFWRTKHAQEKTGEGEGKGQAA